MARFKKPETALEVSALADSGSVPYAGPLDG
jgi:hypothetical protein